MSDSPDKENNTTENGSEAPQMAPPQAPRNATSKRPVTSGRARIPLPFTILIILLVSGVALFAILFALQFFYTRNLGETVPGAVGGNGQEEQDDGAPVSILPEAPGGITVLEKQPETDSPGTLVPSAPIAQGAGIATGFAMDLGAADSFIDLTRRFATIVAENGENNFLRLEPRAVLRETVSGLEARLLVGPFDSEAEAAEACEVLILDEGISCTAQPFEGELIARE